MKMRGNYAKDSFSLERIPENSETSSVVETGHELPGSLANLSL